MNTRHAIAPFSIKDCTLIAIATGKKAQNLRELREYLRDIEPACIYYHFWGGLLRPRFDDPEYHNDFAIWVAHSLHNKALAERLAVIDPVKLKDTEELRIELVDIIEESLDETEFPSWAQRDDQFEFIKAQIVVFDTGHWVKEPQEFVDVLSEMSVGSIFFHLIDGRRRNENGLDDFQNWIMHFGEQYDDLKGAMETIDPYFTPLTRLRDELSDIFSTHFRKAAQ
jgi:hypothetical protein